MNTDDFQKNLTEVHQKVDAVLAVKGDEYAGAADKDRLHNFKVAAGMQGITVKEALGGMMSKHTTSIYDMIADGRDYSQARWDEKIIDHINYLILLRAIVVEERQKSLVKQDASPAKVATLPSHLQAHNVSHLVPKHVEEKDDDLA